MLVNKELFIEKKIELLHPASFEYKDYWREMKKRCIEGYWAGGTWIPPQMYFYLNFGTILLNKSKSSKSKIQGRPQFWDIHLDFFYNWVEARGLSGFEKMPNPTIPIRDLLRECNEDLGAPIYDNESKNLTLMGSRDFGKSYMTANGVIAHEFLFDGLKDYSLENIKTPPTVEILVGASDTKYSSELLKKVKLCLDNLPGGMEVNGIYYPSPLSKITTGTFASGKSVIHNYPKKIGGSWIEAGTKSAIHHRSFGDNPYAAQGMRLSVAVLEEVGFFNNLKSSHEAMVDTMKNSGYKFGSALYIGTGGAMESGTQDVSEIFYSPDTYEMLAIEDTYEQKGKIGMFIPDYLANRHFKDENGISNVEGAKKFEEAERERIRKGKNASTALDAHIQYHPIVPSEMFLTRTGNIFPKKELSDWLGIIENNPKYEDSAFIGDLIMDEDGNVQWKPKHDLPYDIIPIKEFPIDVKKDDVEGAIVIWEHPFKDENGEIPHSLYVAGTDPYDHDKSGTSSLGSTFIYKRFLHHNEWYEIPVAEYTGRPKADGYYKKLIMLLLYYNAKCLYENEKKGLHTYAELKGYDWLLMDQPGIIDDIVSESKVQRGKGIHMSIPLKIQGEVFIKNWLEEEYSPGKLNLTKIRSIPLLKELIRYTRDGNFDRVMAFMMCMYATKERERLTIVTSSRSIPLHKSDFFNRVKFKNQGLAIPGMVKF